MALYLLLRHYGVCVLVLLALAATSVFCALAFDWPDFWLNLLLFALLPGAEAAWYLRVWRDRKWWTDAEHPLRYSGQFTVAFAVAAALRLVLILVVGLAYEAPGQFDVLCGFFMGVHAVAAWRLHLAQAEPRIPSAADVPDVYARAVEVLYPPGPVPQGDQAML